MATLIAGKLTEHLATRANSIDFSAFGLLLPNPDPILKAQGLDIKVYRNMRTDALIGGSIRRRKSAVKSLDWGLDKGRAASRTNKAIQAVLDNLDIERIIGQMLEATLYGYQPLEIAWAKVGGLMVPTDLQAKPPEWFCFDAESNLRLKTRSQPMVGELLPDKKFLLPRQDATYQNPYGFADLSMCYWPLVFKKGGLKFWLAFTEKFGSAFSVGKLPRSATPEEKTTMLDGLAAMMQNGVATIPDDGSVELLEMAGKSASADLYEKLVMHCRGEISIALLGQNQTTEATANKASATAGLEVTSHLRDGDAEIVAAAFNQLIAWMCELNWGGADAPTFSLWDQAAQDTLQAGRDKSNYDAGARYTNAYWMRAYGYEEGDLAQPAPVAAPGAAAAAGAGKGALKGVAEATPTQFADPLATDVTDPTQAEQDQLAQATEPSWTAMVAQLQTVVDNATSLAELQTTLAQAYGAMDSDELVKLMAAAFALAELKGLAAQEILRTVIDYQADPPQG